MTELKQQPLLTPFRLGKLLLRNRIVMARSRGSESLGQKPHKQAEDLETRFTRAIVFMLDKLREPSGAVVGGRVKTVLCAS